MDELSMDSSERRFGMNRRGRRPRQPELLSTEVSTLLEVVRTSTPGQVQRFFNRQVNLLLDDELESLATWLAGEWDPNVDTDHVKSLIASGQHRRAVNAIIAAMRRELVEELRRHKRSQTDEFIEQCVEE